MGDSFAKKEVIYSPSCCNKPVWLSVWSTNENVRQNVHAALSYITKAKHERSAKSLFHRRQRDMRVWNSMRVSKWWEKFHFGWATPLRTQTEDLEKHKALSFVIKIKEDICCERDTRKHYKSAGPVCFLRFSLLLGLCSSQEHVQAIFVNLAWVWPSICSF